MANNLLQGKIAILKIMARILLKALYFKETQWAETIKNPTDKIFKRKTKSM